MVAALAPPVPAQPRPGLPDVTCDACIVVDDAGRTLFARRPNQPLPNASTTKMVTAIVVARLARDVEVVTVSADAASTGGGGLDLAAGDRVSVGDLLHALLLTSSNDAAVALAEHVAGTEGAFVSLMNEFAAAIGARRSVFLTSHGLDAAGHASTARDLARIGVAVLRRPRLAEIVRRSTASIAVDGTTVRLENRNVLLKTYPGSIGIKTGFTAGAGNVLVAAAERQGRSVVAVAMSSDDSFADAAALLDFGFATLARTLLVDAREPVAVVVLDPAGAVPVVPARDVRGPTDPRRLEVVFEPGPSVELPLAAGDTIGTITLVSNGETVEVLDAVAQSYLSEPPEPPSGTALLARLLEAFAGIAART